METYYQVLIPYPKLMLHDIGFLCLTVFVQESGRAGRDGLPSECVLFFRPADVPRQVEFVWTDAVNVSVQDDVICGCCGFWAEFYGLLREFWIEKSV